MENTQFFTKTGSIVFGGITIVGGLAYLIYALSTGKSIGSPKLQKKQGFANPTEIWFMSHPLEGMLVAIVGAMAVIILISLFFARKRF
ncbi:hypothetical protein EBR66_06100 [bacterium]|nr:hypothetical protein [bacterium]